MTAVSEGGAHLGLEGDDDALRECRARRLEAGHGRGGRGWRLDELWLLRDHRRGVLGPVFFAAAAMLDVIAFIAGVITFITPHSVTEIAAVLIAALIASPRRASLLGIVAGALKN